MGYHPIQTLISQMSKLRPKGRRALPKAKPSVSQCRGWFPITCYPKSNTSNQQFSECLGILGAYKHLYVKNFKAHSSDLPSPRQPCVSGPQVTLLPLSCVRKAELAMSHFLGIQAIVRMVSREGDKDATWVFPFKNRLNYKHE